ncbi:hypothetical protein NRL14_13455 [Pseudoalteromonas sp. 20-92]|uniref:hypothetical protein n=1 Tax=Pseudoalteromonas sp. 20-92 TaxID=2969394 RepID=UPI0027AF13AC|nr:hypothetical protein [Pseudoalteromonas sp. 20-92]MDQ2044737.1 hypothetical protein [Pseudoalteromonas sp. 20-92]
MNIKTPIAALLLCALLSACSTASRSDPNLCIEKAETFDRNGAQTSSQVYNQCISAQIKRDEKNDTFFDTIGKFFFEFFVMVVKK